MNSDPFQMHNAVIKTNQPNFMQTMLLCIFLLGPTTSTTDTVWLSSSFSRACDLVNEVGNHKSAVDYLRDVGAYTAYTLLTQIPYHKATVLCL